MSCPIVSPIWVTRLLRFRKRCSYMDWTAMLHWCRNSFCDTNSYRCYAVMYILDRWGWRTYHRWDGFWSFDWCNSPKYRFSVCPWRRRSFAVTRCCAVRIYWFRRYRWLWYFHKRNRFVPLSYLRSMRWSCWSWFLPGRSRWCRKHCGWGDRGSLRCRNIRHRECSCVVPSY